MREIDRKLHDAVMNGNITEATVMINHGADVNARDGKECTALHWAARYGYADIVRRLLETEAIAVNAQNKGGKTALHWAACNGHSTVVEILLGNKRIDVTLVDADGNTALHWAAYANPSAAGERVYVDGHSAIVTKLLDVQEIIIDARNESGNTALHLAAMNTQVNVVGLLLEAGATTTITDNEGKRAREVTKNSEIINLITMEERRRGERSAHIDPVDVEVFPSPADAELLMMPKPRSAGITPVRTIQEIADALRTATAVLIVEDDPHVRGALKRVVRREGLTIYEAGTLEEALAHSGKVDENTVVITDYKYPSGNIDTGGNSVVRSLHEAVGRRCKLFAIMTTEIDIGEDAPFKACAFTKPMCVLDLQTAIKGTVSGGGGTSSLGTSFRAPQRCLSPTPGERVSLGLRRARY